MIYDFALHSHKSLFSDQVENLFAGNFNPCKRLHFIYL